MPEQLNHKKYQAQQRPALIQYLQTLPNDTLSALVDFSTLFTDEQIKKIADKIKNDPQIKQLIINYLTN